MAKQAARSGTNATRHKAIISLTLRARGHADQDILDRLAELPPGERSTFIRRAIRHYLHCREGQDDWAVYWHGSRPAAGPQRPRPPLVAAPTDPEEGAATPPPKGEADTAPPLREVLQQFRRTPPG